MKKLSLNRNQLKYLVIAAMLIDHIAWAFVPMDSLLGQVMHFIGRLTGPTMAYFLYEGYLHTRNVKKYALRLGIFALLSWPPFSFFELGTWFDPQFGVIYTLLLGLLAIWMWDRARLPKWAKIILVVFLCVLSYFGDWLVFDVLWPLFLFLRRDDEARKWRIYWIIALAASLPTVILCFFISDVWWEGLCNLGILLVPPLLRYCYNGESGSRHPFHKWFFYAFYPAHLLVLGLLKAVL